MMFLHLLVLEKHRCKELVKFFLLVCHVWCDLQFMNLAF